MTKDYVVASSTNYTMPKNWTIQMWMYWSDTGNVRYKLLATLILSQANAQTKIAFQYAGADGLIIASNALGYLKMLFHAVCITNLNSTFNSYIFLFDTSPIISWTTHKLFALTVSRLHIV